MNFELTDDFLDQLRDVISTENKEKTLELIEKLHPADIAEMFDEISIDDAKYIYLLLEKEIAADVFVELEDDLRDKFLKILPSEVIAKQLIHNIESDDAADIIGELSEKKQEEVLSQIHDREQAGDIVDLLNYDEDTAGGVMAKELISVNENSDVQSCIEEIRRQAENIEHIYNVYVVDDNNILKGLLSLKRLVVSSPSTKIATICTPDVMSVRVDKPADEVGIIMQKYDLVSIPVVDSIGRLLGQITIDDIVEVMREEAEKDYQMISGISEDVEHSDSPWLLTRARLPWLLIGLIGGIIGSRVIAYYEVDLGIYPEMIFFLPLIAAMGGNVGVQSSAIIVQGLANNSITNVRTINKLSKEFLVAFINGIVCSSLIFAYNYFVSDTFILTVTVSVALFAVIIFASLFGTFVPLALNRFKIDPALATGPFITTVNDIMGLFIYLLAGRILFSLFA
ncbi:MAG TPA: magnesium transporter [Bacteroidales bacterium]|nr:MAG: magnesium transporter [Bacteroidetes bacterium GWF2_33_38]OFY74602.1 MAG: magnesium transporter [Bacteroidetes bacterium RIFOXYA12_FULL_33_9]HBF87586.1 magnesium transporter [Bacteroidales bacterium]